MIVINDKKNCTGCQACFNICQQACITMENDSEGFWYPFVDIERCIKCGHCKKVCPILNKKEVKNEPQVYACINKDEYTRIQSSSGGVFTLIAEEVIKNGGLVFGAEFNEDFSVSHNYIETKEDIYKLRGSKYVQSKIGDTYKLTKELLKQGRQVLFTGTPCQIGGLRSYLGQTQDNLFCIDIICHGVPSPKVWHKYVQFQEKTADATTLRISFRRKVDGWKKFSVSFLFNNKTEYFKTLDKDLFMRAFLKDICLRPSCYDCEFKTLHRQSDITLGDFWGIQYVFPEMDDDKGTSLVFINSTSGRAMFEKIKNKTIYKEAEINKAVYYNSAAIKSARHNLKRQEFFCELDQLSFDRLVKKYCAERFTVSAKRRVKSAIGILLRKMHK